MKDENGTCANCGQRIYRTHGGAWKHCYIVTEKCATATKKAMPRKS